MLIQINTDKSVTATENFSANISDTLKDSLSRYSENITRVEVHFADENGSKQGQNDKRCVLEARVEGLAPVAVTAHADTLHQALDAATDKLKHALESKLGKLRTH